MEAALCKMVLEPAVSAHGGWGGTLAAVGEHCMYYILRLFTPDHGKVEHLSPSPESCVRCKLALPLLLTLKQAHYDSCDR